MDRATGGRQRIRDATFGFAGDYVGGIATIAFTARIRTQRPVYVGAARADDGRQPAVGFERNGVFF